MINSVDHVPSISFAIPYYDNPDYLLEAVASVRDQTVTDWELVVVDDAGPSPALEAVEALGDRRISYVRNEHNLGLAGNWNECIRRSRAELVTVLHADDRLLPTYAERVLAAARQHPAAAAVFTDVNIIGPDGRPTVTVADVGKHLVRRPSFDHDVVGDRGMAGLLVGNYILCPTLCMRRAVVGPDPFDARWRFVPDLDFTVSQLLAGRTLRSIREPLLEYRRHTGSQTSSLTSDSSRFEEEFTFLARMSAAAEAKGWKRSARAGRLRLTARSHLALRLVLDLLRGRLGPARQKLRILGRDLRHGQRVGAHDADPQQ
jgi:glycosyltransferase involved in cell wall biosynthesis